MIASERITRGTLSAASAGIRIDSHDWPLSAWPDLRRCKLQWPSLGRKLPTQLAIYSPDHHPSTISVGALRRAAPAVSSGGL